MNIIHELDLLLEIKLILKIPNSLKFNFQLHVQKYVKIVNKVNSIIHFHSKAELIRKL